MTVWQKWAGWAISNFIVRVPAVKPSSSFFNYVSELKVPKVMNTPFLINPTELVVLFLKETNTQPPIPPVLSCAYPNISSKVYRLSDKQTKQNFSRSRRSVKLFLGRCILFQGSNVAHRPPPLPHTFLPLVHFQQRLQLYSDIQELKATISDTR